MRVRLSTEWLPTDLRAVARVLGSFALVFSLTMALPVVVGLLVGETAGGRGNATRGFALSAAIGLAVGALLVLAGRGRDRQFFRREGVLSVALVWVLVGMLGGLPFWLSGWVDGFFDGFFESASGITTTGTTILGAGKNPLISEMPPSLLFWRAWLHWIGGLGIVVTFLIFLPALGITEKALVQAEITGVSKGGLKPRIRQSAFMLLRIYLAITLGLVVAYWLLGMTLFEAVAHAFATICTGGFSTRDYSVGQFNSAGLEIAVIAGMFLSATNFALYYGLAGELRGGEVHAPERQSRLRRCLGVFWRDAEFRAYAGIMLGAVAIVTLSLWWRGGVVAGQELIGRNHDYDSLGGCLRDAWFQVTSWNTCCGFANSNANTLPALAQVVLVIVMLTGGCSGSTSGGLKVARIVVLWKLAQRAVRRFLRPRVIEPLRVGGQPLDAETGDAIVALSFVWLSTLVLGTLVLLALAPVDILSAFTSMVTSLSNAGPALTTMAIGQGGNELGVDVGSYGSFGAFPPSAKAFLTLVMLLGRLEILTLLVVMLPGFWKE
jgi:trk system potassium uptake protein TrkH